MPIRTDNPADRPKPAAAHRRFRPLILLLLLALLLPCATPAESTLIVASQYEHPVFPAPEIPIGARVADAYFTGAVLVGDSIAEGLSIHQLMPELTVLSVIGLSPRTAESNKLFKHDKQPVTLAEKLVALNPTVVYLFLGSNGVDMKPADQVIADMDRLLNTLIAALPETPIILLELTPVMLRAQEQYRSYTNERVDKFNEALYDVALRHNVYLLRVNAVLRNDKGRLDAAYGAGDGIHLTKEGYAVLADFLYTRTLPLEVTIP